MDAIKLQKLVYYVQAWHLAWTGSPLFDDELQAWKYGSVEPVLFRHHQGLLTVFPETIPGDPSAVGDFGEVVTDSVLEFYGTRGSSELQRLNHSEIPWKLARKNLKPHEKGSEPIGHDIMRDFYANKTDGPARPVELDGGPLLRTQIHDLKTTRDGWLDGQGLAPRSNDLDQIEGWIRATKPEALPVPHLYPTPSGGTQAEWTFGGIEVSIEFLRDTSRAELCWVDCESDQDGDVVFDSTDLKASTVVWSKILELSTK